MKELIVKDIVGSEVLRGSRNGNKLLTESILPIIDSMSVGEGFCIDLSGVVFLDDSYANQAFALPIVMLKEEKFSSDRRNFLWFKVRSSSMVKGVLDRVLNNNQLIAFINLDEKPEIIGDVGRALIETIEKIQSHGEVQVEKLPGIVGIDSNIFFNRIQRLLSFGIIKEYTREGKKYIQQQISYV